MREAAFGISHDDLERLARGEADAKHRDAAALRLDVDGAATRRLRRHRDEQPVLRAREVEARQIGGERAHVRVDGLADREARELLAHVDITPVEEKRHAQRREQDERGDAPVRLTHELHAVALAGDAVDDRPHLVEGESLALLAAAACLPWSDGGDRRRSARLLLRGVHDAGNGAKTKGIGRQLGAAEERVRRNALLKRAHLRLDGRWRGLEESFKPRRSHGILVRVDEGERLELRQLKELGAIAVGPSAVPERGTRAWVGPRDLRIPSRRCLPSRRSARRRVVVVGLPIRHHAQPLRKALRKATVPDGLRRTDAATGGR